MRTSRSCFNGGNIIVFMGVKEKVFVTVVFGGRMCRRARITVYCQFGAISEAVGGDGSYAVWNKDRRHIDTA